MQLSDPASLGFSGERLARIRPWMLRYVDSERLPGVLVMVSRHGEPVYSDWVGLRDVERALPVEEDTIFRIYSMTKTLASVALMTLYEQGRFLLDDPVGRYLPPLARLEVFESGTAEHYSTVPAEQPVTIRHLLTHTSGFTYDFIDETPVAKLYNQHKVHHVFGRDDSREFIRKLSEIPLLAQPGSEWNYSVSTDVVGCLVEVLADRPFDDYLREVVLDPLGMVDTDFYVHEDRRPRFGCCYTPAGPQGGLTLADDSRSSRFLKPPAFPSGGGGLVSTAHDYLRFLHCLLGQGSLAGTRVLGRKTVEYMLRNHLPGDMASMGQPRFSETSYEGIGFGLAGSVVVDAAKSEVLQSDGTFAWGGMASTGFWLDRVEGVCTVLMTQLQPSSSYPIRNELRALVNQALVE